MENKEFRKIIDGLARGRDFIKLFNNYFKKSEECILSLGLQKSNFGNYYYLNVKIFVHGVFGNHYSISKELVNDTGNVFIRPPGEYDRFLDLELTLADEDRKKNLEKMFNDFIIPFTTKALTKEGIKELANTDQICLLPAVRKELGF